MLVRAAADDKAQVATKCARDEAAEVAMDLLPIELLDDDVAETDRVLGVAEITAHWEAGTDRDNLENEFDAYVRTLRRHRRDSVMLAALDRAPDEATFRLLHARFCRYSTYVSPMACLPGDTTEYWHQLLAIEVSFYSRDYLPHGAWLRKQDCDELVEIARAHSLLSDKATLAFVPYLYHASELTSLSFSQVWRLTTSLSMFGYDFDEPPWVNGIPDAISPWPIRTWRLTSDLVDDLAFVLGMLRMPAGQTCTLAKRGVMTRDYPLWREQTSGLLQCRLPQEQQLTAPAVELPRPFHHALHHGLFYHHLTILQIRISELQIERVGRLSAALGGVMSLHGVLGQVQEARVSLISATDGRWLEGIILPLWGARVGRLYFRDLASNNGLGTVAFELIEELKPMHRCPCCGWELFPLPSGEGSTCGRAACSRPLQKDSE